MPRTVYLHIGLPKTGSTFLQMQLFPKLSHLNAVSMPANNHFREEGTRLFESIFSRSDTIWQHDAESIVRALLGADWRADDRSILLSDEAIGRLTSRQALCAGHLSGMKRAFLDRGFDRFKLLFLVRRQDQWLASHYVQISDRRKDPSQRDFEQLAERIADPLNERFTFGAMLDYASTFTAIADVLGRENVCAIPMEWLSMDRNKLQESIAGWLDLSTDRISLDGQHSENVRRSGQDTWKLRKGPRLREARRTLLRQPSHIHLSPELSNRILGVYQESNRLFEHLTGSQLEALGYYA